MPSVLGRYATPFITGLFIVSLISGIALFFHIGPSGFHGMHEWLSMVLIVPCALHLWKNWRPFLNYFRRLPLGVALRAGEAGGPPPFAFSHAILANPASDVAPLLGMTSDELCERLGAAGIVVADPARSVSEAIAASGKPEMQAIAALVRPAG